MKVLVFTNLYPFAAMPFYGSFVRDEVEALRKLGHDVDVLFVNGIANKVNYFASPFRFVAALRKAEYDIIHVHHSFCGLVAMWQRRIPVVWTFHEGEIMGGEEMRRREHPIKVFAYAKRLKQKVAGRVDAVIVVSDRMREPLGRDDAVTIPSGIDLDLFKPMDRTAARAALDMEPQKRYVLFPSTPARPEKRFDLASESVQLIADEADDVDMIVLDNVAHERVPLYMNAADVLLMTSSFEASPVTVREALACGLPVVSTDVGDVADAVRGIDGCHIVDDDTGAIASALRRVLARGGRVDAKGRVEAWSLSSTAERVVAVYGAVIGKRRSESGGG